MKSHNGNEIEQQTGLDPARHQRAEPSAERSARSELARLLSLYRARHGDEQAEELCQRLAPLVSLLVQESERPHGWRCGGNDWQEAYRDFRNESLVM